ncbi:MAG TPA: hypothetical protein VJ846_07200 [Sphingomicrobium sp.]|nr:hypothetical protein [Sphingomicrobium sp.]
MDDPKEAAHQKWVRKYRRKGSGTLAPGKRPARRLDRLYEEHEYAGERLSRALDADPCDLLEIARILRDLAAIEHDIIDYKNRFGRTH